VKQGFPLSPTLFGIYIDKLEACLEVACCVRRTLASIVIILLIYVDDIFLMERNPNDLNKQLSILKEFCSSKRLTMNTYKKKVMIVKSKNTTYDTFVYDKNASEDVP